MRGLILAMAVGSTAAHAGVPTGVFETDGAPSELSIREPSCGPAGRQRVRSTLAAIPRVEVGDAWIDLGTGRRSITVRTVDRVAAATHPIEVEPKGMWIATVIVEGRRFTLILIRHGVRAGRRCTDVLGVTVKLIA